MLLSQVQTLPTQDMSKIVNPTSGPIAPDVDVVPLSAIPVLFSNILGVAIALIGLASFAMLVSGGLKFLTSGGDPKGVEQGKNTITWAVAGLVLAILSYLILKYLGQFLGISDITIFKWPD